MTDAANERAKAFVIERDLVLMRGDLDEVEAFLKRHSGRVPSSREALEITLHKARAAATTLPMELRSLSKRWLTERGYTSLDDGDVP